MSPVWSPDGRFLYFADPDEGDLKRVAVEYEPSLRVFAPEVALTADQLDGLALRTTYRFFAIFPDGERFVFIESGQLGDREQPHINITLNWLTQLQSLMPVE